MTNIVTVQETTPSFVRSKHKELAKVHKKLDILSLQMIDFLMSNIENKEVDIKLRMQYADKLLGYHVQVSELVNKDNLQRMIAQIKVGGKITPSGSSVGDERRAIPVVDFDNIVEI